jgi:serine/threonine protein kinase
MDAERWKRIKRLFEAALERAEPEREPFLDEACGNDRGLRRDLDSLLSGEKKLGDFLEEPIVRFPASSPANDNLPPLFSPGEIVAERFQILRFIGRGGMGEVYEARDRARNVRVALKTVRSEIASDPKTMVRFNREIELALCVTHHNVCRVHDLERHRPPEGSGQPDVVFLTMELLEGETLADRLRRQGRMSCEEALPLIRQMADGLAAAHKEGVVHCDFKAGNVMLVSERPVSVDPNQETESVSKMQAVVTGSTAGPVAPAVNSAVRAVITDFGLARAMRPTVTRQAIQESLESRDHLVGTLPYMAPEQLEGLAVTPASDVYAFGLVAYEMVTGRQPFSGITPLSAIYKRLEAMPPRPRKLARDVSGGLDSVIMCCLEREPEARYANAQELAGALARMPTGRGTFFGLQPGLVIFFICGLTLLWLFLRFIVWRPNLPVTSSSPQAKERYESAWELYQERNFPGSIERAESAINLDPGFAMAHLLLAKDYDEKGDASDAEQQLALAKQSSERVTEREKFLIRAYDDYYQSLFQGALEEYQAALRLNPNDRDALQGLASTAYWVGQPEMAIGAQRKILGLSEHYAEDYIVVMHLLIRLSRFSEALNVAAEAKASSIQCREMHWPLSLAYWGLDNLEAARRELDLLRQGGGTREADLATLFSGRILQYEGRLQEADNTLRPTVAFDIEQKSLSWIPFRTYLLVEGDLARGRMDQAQLDAARLSVNENQDASDLQFAGLVFIEVGRLADAERYLSALDKLRSDRNSVYTQVFYFNLKGEVDLAQGRLQDAAASETQATVLYGRHEPYYSLAKICTQEADWHCAADAYTKYLEFKGEILRDDCPISWVMAHLQLAGVYAKLGNQAEAAHYYDKFLDLWAHADPDLPALQQARQERNSLDSKAFQVHP